VVTAHRGGKMDDEKGTPVTINVEPAKPKPKSEIEEE
jgi:hypothetical protein